MNDEIKDNSMQPYDIKEYTQEMPYKGAAHGAEMPRSGYAARTHAHITDRLRKEQLKDIGLETREEYIDCDAEAANAMKEIRQQRIKRKCFIFVAMLVLSIITGAIISGFWEFNIFVGIGIGAAIGAVLFILPMVIYLITNRVKK